MGTIPDIDSYSSKKCVCPNCGHQEPYHPAIPCYHRRCPKCESPLIEA